MLHPWELLSALGQGSGFAAAGSSVGQDAALSLELAGRLPLLLIQPPCKLEKQNFVHLVCHLSLRI